MNKLLNPTMQMENYNPGSGSGSIHDPLIHSPKGTFALSGKIMLSSMIILFAVVVFMVCFHLYARWYCLRRRRVNLNRRRSSQNHRQTHVVFSGLEPAVLSSLPVFVYSSKIHTEILECSVCLSEFEESEMGRVLPKCNHSFHLECIDMWFHSHSTCPLCRSPVESVNEPAVTVAEPVEPVTETGSGSGTESGSGTTSFGGQRKDFRIDVPRRNEFETEQLEVNSPASHGFRSPGTRFLSLKRILSMNNKKTVPREGNNSPGIGTSRDSVATELDLECGGV